MDVFIRGVQPLVGDKELMTFFQPVLENLGITLFAVHKQGKFNANMTFVTLREARLFLQHYGQGSQKSAHLRVANQPMYFSENTRPVDKFQIRSRMFRLLSH
jgi:hypothetical protein